MPGLVRKILIIAAVDGLVLQPARNNAGSFSPLRIEYKSKRIQSLPAGSNYHNKGDERLESDGIIGLLSLASYSFLISITKREQVAQILGKPIFVVTGVAVIPLSSQNDAAKALLQAQRSLTDKKDYSSGTDSSAESDSDQSDAPGLEQTSSHQDGLPVGNDGETPTAVAGHHNESHIAEDVIKKRGHYRRFASQWFFDKIWQGEGKASADAGSRKLSDPAAQGRESNRDLKRRDSSESMELNETDSKGKAVSPPQAPASVEDEVRTYELMPKFLRYTKMFFGSRSFYFSYDYDISRRFGTQNPQDSRLPLSTRADPLFFWNRYLLSPFIEGGHHEFALPLVQGFVGQQEFTADPLSGAEDRPAKEEDTLVTDGVAIMGPTETSREDDKFLLTLISRRSVKRSGVRFLRRGVDDEGNAANTVETEQILSRPSWDTAEPVYSLVQLRGSIPLYFSQTPYTFKPVPVLRHSTARNQQAFDKHFHWVGRRYGKAQVVCLLDKHGGEVKIGEAYGEHLDSFNKRGGLNGYPVGYEWFDFHSECRGMKFENVRKLVDNLEPTLTDYGDTVVRNNEILRAQSGVVRTNCMDCLDRTGVTQCAFGQRALEQQLEQEGFTIDLKTSITTQWFNILWADNGDAISRQYSSTAALKGDYTRTRKRDYRGALNDFGLTLSRYYNNIVNDYFSQACIDYLLGHVTTAVFDEFESELASTDPGISMENMRQNAIEISCRIVIGDDNEELVGGWTMLSPRQPNTLRSLPFEQSVLLLTNAAVYCCRFDWVTEKVTSFERIDLDDITNIKYGTYITSTLTDAQMDEKRNVGIVITFTPGQNSTLRVNTRSLHSEPAQFEEKKESSEWSLLSFFKGSNQSSVRYAAFKIPQTTSVAVAGPSKTTVRELDAARTICDEIERTARKRRGSDHPEELSLIEEAEIISPADAKKRTGYLEHLMFDIKRRVWA